MNPLFLNDALEKAHQEAFGDRIKGGKKFVTYELAVDTGLLNPPKIRKAKKRGFIAEVIDSFMPFAAADRGLLRESWNDSERSYHRQYWSNEDGLVLFYCDDSGNPTVAIPKNHYAL